MPYSTTNRQICHAYDSHHPNASKCRFRLGPSTSIQLPTASLTSFDNPAGPQAATITCWLASHSLAMRRIIECTSGLPGTAYGGKGILSPVGVAGISTTTATEDFSSSSSEDMRLAGLSASTADNLVMCTCMLIRGCVSSTASSVVKPSS
jgi:hypothetical protein